MDWMKLEILIAVRNNIENKKPIKFICNQIKAEMDKRYGYTSDEEVEEFFHEFTALYDGVFWDIDDRSYKILINGGAWWSIHNSQSRLDILDFIIANRSM
jgi:hypothetical protein